MACLIPLASSTLSCCKPFCNEIINSIIQKFHNFKSVGENINSLQKMMAKLNALKLRINNNVNMAERRGGQRRHDQVDLWLNGVQSLEVEVNSIIERHQKRSMFCYLNIWLNWTLGQKAAHILEEVKNHITRGEEFRDNVSHAVESMIDTRVVGLALEELKRCFEREEVSVVGIYGTGGVGKTTLLKMFNDDLRNGNDYDAVIFINVSKEPDIDDIQEKIKNRLRLSWEGNENQEGRANKIHDVMKKMRFVLLLDDVWNEFDEKTLEAIGIPHPHKENKCKLVLTTRFEVVCSQMGASDNKIRVNFMKKDEAWELFKMNCGEKKFRLNQRMEKVAKQITEKCGGLPLALIVIGKALASKATIEEWEHAESALEDLRIGGIAGMEKTLLKSLKYSYDNMYPDDATLKETMQKCFLYCCLFPEGISITKELLVDYWVGEGFFHDENGDDIDKARLMGHSIIRSLKSVCLLESGDIQDTVKMHDVIRDMARWIANDCTWTEQRFVIPTRKEVKNGLNHVSVFPERLAMAERISLVGNHNVVLPEIAPACHNLLTLLLQGCRIKTFPIRFFEYMLNLQVLDLSYNHISELPDRIGSLVNLQYLNLSNTDITSLPKELGELKRLRQLYLIKTLKLKRIPKEAILGLSRLEVFDLRTSYYLMYYKRSSNDHSLNDLDGLTNLRDLRLLLNYNIFVDKFMSSNKLPKTTRELALFNGNDVITLDLSGMVSLKQFGLVHFPRLEELKLGGKRGSTLCLETLTLLNNPKLMKVDVAKGQYSETLPNLSYLFVANCESLEITWLHQLPCLRIIIFCHAPYVELLSVPDQGSSEVFQKLERITLSKNQEMERISQHTLTLPSLEYLNVDRCPKLKKLALGLSSAPRLKEIRGSQEWWDGLEWEDDQTKQIFAGLFKRLV